MTSSEPKIEENKIAKAFAEALAERLGKNPRRLRTPKDFKFLGQEVLRVIQNTQA